jgi:hypothetical protein
LAGLASAIDELNPLFRGLMKPAWRRMLGTETGAHRGRQEVLAPLDRPPDGPHPLDVPEDRRDGHSQEAVLGWEQALNPFATLFEGRWPSNLSG